MDFGLRITLGMALLGLLFGFFSYRADFCLAGMVRDYILFRSTRILRPFLLSLAVMAPLFELVRLSGLSPYTFFSPPSLLSFAGGAVFGAGMVLSGACSLGMFWRLGSGQGVQLASVAGFVAGVGLYAEITPAMSAIGKATRFSESLTAAKFLDISPFWLMVPLLAVCAVYIARWFSSGAMSVRERSRGFIQPWKAALWLAGVEAASMALVGVPLATANGAAKLAAGFESLFSPDHVAENSFFMNVVRMELPLQGGVLNWGYDFKWDEGAMTVFPMMVATVLGAFIAAKTAGDFELHFRVPPKQYLSALAGGILIGVGSRLAGGCVVWHLFGGLPILALSSILFFVGLFPGTYLGTRLISP